MPSLDVVKFLNVYIDLKMSCVRGRIIVYQLCTHCRVNIKSQILQPDMLGSWAGVSCHRISACSCTSDLLVYKRNQATCTLYQVAPTSDCRWPANLDGTVDYKVLKMKIAAYKIQCYLATVEQLRAQATHNNTYTIINGGLDIYSNFAFSTSLHV